MEGLVTEKSKRKSEKMKGAKLSKNIKLRQKKQQKEDRKKGK